MGRSPLRSLRSSHGGRLAEAFLHLSGDLKEGFDRGFARFFSKFSPDELCDLQLECQREWLFFLGEEWLGRPSTEVRARIDAIADVPELERLIEKLTDERPKISSWDEWLAMPKFASTGGALIR